MRVLPLVFLVGLSPPVLASAAEAKLGERLTPSRELAQAHGARAVELHPGPAPWGFGEPVVLAETWWPPEGGWSREQANAIIKMLVNNRRRLMVKTSRDAEGWAFTLRFEDDVMARCRYTKDRVRELHVRTPAFDQEGQSPAGALRYEFPAPAVRKP